MEASAASRRTVCAAVDAQHGVQVLPAVCRGGGHNVGAHHQACGAVTPAAACLQPGPSRSMCRARRRMCERQHHVPMHLAARPLLCTHAAGIWRPRWHALDGALRGGPSAAAVADPRVRVALRGALHAMPVDAHILLRDSQHSPPRRPGHRSSPVRWSSSTPPPAMRLSSCRLAAGRPCCGACSRACGRIRRWTCQTPSGGPSDTRYPPSAWRRSCLPSLPGWCVSAWAAARCWASRILVADSAPVTWNSLQSCGPPRLWRLTCWLEWGSQARVLVVVQVCGKRDCRPDSRLLAAHLYGGKAVLTFVIAAFMYLVSAALAGTRGGCVPSFSA